MTRKHEGGAFVESWRRWHSGRVVTKIPSRAVEIDPNTSKKMTRVTRQRVQRIDQGIRFGSWANNVAIEKKLFPRCMEINNDIHTATTTAAAAAAVPFHPQLVKDNKESPYVGTLVQVPPSTPRRRQTPRVAHRLRIAGHDIDYIKLRIVP